METADKKAMFVEATESVVIERAHDLGSLTTTQDLLALQYIFLGALFKLLTFFRRQCSQPLPKLGPLCICMVEEIAVAAIIKTAYTAKTKLFSHRIILLSYFLVDGCNAVADIFGKERRRHGIELHLIIEKP